MLWKATVYFIYVSLSIILSLYKINTFNTAFFFFFLANKRAILLRATKCKIAQGKRQFCF